MVTEQRAWRVRGCCLPALVVAVVVAAAPSGAQQSPTRAVPSQTPTSGVSLKPQPRQDEERRGVVPAAVPHPGSLEPRQVVENVKALLRAGNLLENSGIPELADEGLRARRILRVTSALIPPGYLVVELSDGKGRSVANVALTQEGHFIMLEDARGEKARRPLPLDDAASRVLGRRGRAPMSTGYVYFHNTAERGVSLCRPLVAAKTEQGEIYLNSLGQAFVEDGSPLAAELRLTSQPEPTLLPPQSRPTLSGTESVKRLLPAGQW